MDRANYALAAALAARGVDVHLVAYRADEDLLAMPNVTLHRVPKLASSYRLSAPLLDRVGQWWAKRLGARVVVNGGNCRWGDVNWVHFVHAAYQGSRVSHRAREKAIVPLSRIVITTTDRNRADLIERVGVPPEKVHVVPLGIDPTLFHPASDAEKAAARRALGLPEGGPIVAFIGSMIDPRKGFDTLAAAWTMLEWDAHLAIAGAGQPGPSRPHVHYLGFLPGAQTLLAAADVLVAPSRYEPYSVAAHEALACGLPVFITASAGIAGSYPANLRDLLLPDATDAKALAARLRAWRADPDSYRGRVAPFGEALRVFTWEAMAEKMIALIDCADTDGAVSRAE